MTATKSIRTKLFAHIETWRPYTVIWCGLVSLAGASLTWGSLPPLYRALVSLFVPMMGWIAALYLSDYLDRRLDTIQKPHRPIPSGRIHPKEALAVGGVFVICGSILTLWLSVLNIVLVFVVAISVLGYTYFSKSRGLIGNINRGFVTVIAFFYGVFSTGFSLQQVPVFIWFLAPLFLIHDANSNLVGAIRDMEGDKKGGYQTIPVKYGLKISIIIAIFLNALWLILALLLPLFFSFVSIYFYYIMIIDIAILLSFYMYLFRSLSNYSRKKALKYHEFYVIERITLASAFLFGVLSPSVAILIYASALISTILFQQTLRKRYEFME